jgi:hypothetical protein
LLKDLTGATTTVHFAQAGAAGLIAANDPTLSGDNALLLNDGLITYTYGVDSCFYFYGLQPGTYELITYAWRPDHPTEMAFSHVDNTPGTEVSGGVWTGHHVHGVTYAREIVTVDSSGFMGPHSGLDASADPAVGAVANGMQLRRIDQHTPYCFRDGSGTACPCGNNGVAGNGCANSITTNGAHLAAMGAASVSGDTLMLIGNNMPNGSALYFQGTTQLSGGAGAVFGDGLRCVGGSIVRIAPRTNVSGGSSYPSSGETPISVRGSIPVSGGTYDYQVWYRNAASFCTSATFNLSNGVRVDWQP